MYEASIDEAIVNILKGSGAGLKGVFLRNAPTGGWAKPPYAVCLGNLTTTPALRGDSRVLRYERQAQIDLFDTVEGEDPTRIRLVREAFDGAYTRLANGEGIYFRFVSSQDVPEPQGDNLTHHTFTVELAHSPQSG